MPSKTTNPLAPRFFTGVFEHAVDSVNRLVIPSKWRTGEPEELFIFPKDEGRLAVLTLSEMQKTVEMIESSTTATPEQIRQQSRNLFSSATQITCDKQGRMTMDAKLMKHAGLKDAVTLVGGGPRFDIYEPAAWTRLQAAQKLDGSIDQFGI